MVLVALVLAVFVAIVAVDLVAAVGQGQGPVRTLTLQCNKKHFILSSQTFFIVRKSKTLSVLQCRSVREI